MHWLVAGCFGWQKRIGFEALVGKNVYLGSYVLRASQQPTIPSMKVELTSINSAKSSAALCPSSP